MAEPNASRPASARDAMLEAETTAQLARVIIDERLRLKAANAPAPQGVRACRGLTEVVDLAIQRMLDLALPEETAVREATRPKIAVVATGGYGRRELCPFSDIDVTFIVSEEEDPALDATVRRMFLTLMETFGQQVGLKVGYGYRTPSDLAHLDHQTISALLDTRVIAGSHGLTERFLRELFRHIWPAAFVRLKVAERSAIVAGHGGALHQIEPQVREGPGGLRDLHLAEWLAAVSFPSTRGDVWRQLQRLGAVSRRNVQQVIAAREFLLLVRTWMHWETGRPADLLVRERQEALAEALHYQDDDRASRVERFMEQYYEHAENVQRVTAFVTERCLSERLSLSDELVCCGSELHPAYPWLNAASPQFLVELGQHYQEYGLGPGHELRRMIAEHVGSCPDLSADTEAADDFLNLLRAPAPPAPSLHMHAGPGWTGKPGVYATLALLTSMGALQRLIPEVGEAYRRVPFDLVHKHTIGFHSLEVVRELEELRSTEDPALQDFRRIWSEVQAPQLLYLAGFLHDIGKLAARKGHSETGAALSASICERLRVDPGAAERIVALVRHHLLMSDTAQLRDLTLDKTLQDFTAVVDSVDMLNMLLLLTYADMAATGVMSPVKIRFLLDLYYRAEQALMSPETPVGAAAVTPERARRFRSRLSRQLAATSLTPEQIQEHTEGMPVSYLLNTRPDEIALHIRMMESLFQTGPVVEFDHEPGSEITTIHICTLERPEPGLLSQIAGVLYAHEISVHAAQVFTRHTEPSVALDTLWADYHGRGIPPLKRMELEQDLVSTLKGGDVEAVVARYRKQLPAALPLETVRVDNELAEGHTVIELRAEDQPALLYRITRAIAALGWDIHSARISTRGDQARDAFYVTGPDGAKLRDEESRLLDAFHTEFMR